VTHFNIQIEDNLKNEAEILFNNMGLNLTSAINIFFRQAVREQALPFSVKPYEPNPFYSKANMEHLRNVYADMKAGRNMSVHELIEVEDD
jgi:DNA-damage-inducible protein J